jgi:hypothetical protein
MILIVNYTCSHTYTNNFRFRAHHGIGNDSGGAHYLCRENIHKYNYRDAKP